MGAVPLTLPIPCPDFEKHRSTIAALFGSGTLPALNRKPRENPLAYTVRALEEWARSYPSPLEIQLEDAQGVLKDHAEYFDHQHTDEVVDAGDADLIVRVYGPSSDVYSAAAMLRALRPLHPRLGGSLLHHIGQVSGRGFGILTPSGAWDLAEIHTFYGSERDFWQSYRHAAAAELKKSERMLTRPELQAYISNNGLLTPRAFKRALGLDLFDAVQRPLSLEEIRKLLMAENFPERQKRQIEDVLLLLADIENMGRLLQELDGDESGVLYRMHQASYSRYATILDVTPWEMMGKRWGFIQEILNDHEHIRMQSDEEEGPNFAMFLRPGDDSVSRFQEAVDLLNSCLQAVLYLTQKIDNWER